MSPMCVYGIPGAPEASFRPLGALTIPLTIVCGTISAPALAGQQKCLRRGREGAGKRFRGKGDVCGVVQGAVPQT